MEPPVKPDEADCCNSGCKPCILDVYEYQLEKYKESLLQSEEIKYKSYRNCIYPTTYSVFVLKSREKHTNDTYFFTFKYCRSTRGEIDATVGQRLMYKPGQHFLLKGCNELSKEEFTRAYTPIPLKENGGLMFTILARLYESGKMSSYLRSLENGQETLWRGPYCDFTIDYSSNYTLFIAQGTGIAPIFAILTDMLSNESCDTFLHLFFCCRTADDILIRNEIYELQSHWNFQYEVFLSNSLFVSRKYNEVIHEKKLAKFDIERFLDNKMNGLKSIICGSSQFGNCIKGHLKSCGVEDENIYIFD